MEDEIICTACGRPNLTRAERCWFCQNLLDKTSAAVTQPQEFDAEVEALEKDIQNRKAREIPVQEAPIPDWLKKVRELTKADMPPEERAKWEQEHLFGEVQSARKPTRDKSAQTHTASKATHPAKAVEQQETPAVLPADEVNEENVDHSGDDSDGNSLPDGFKPLR